MKDLFYALRPNQWVKNLFVFFPLIFGKKLFDFPTNLKTIAAFFLFCIISGVAYLINDILDLEKDKSHPIKCLRPIPSGKISIKQALSAILILGILSIGLCFMLNTYFGCVIIIYIVFNFIYSKILKKIVIIDVFCIGGFFLLRIAAGTVMARVDFSYWMIFMTALLALFLGFNKRRQELVLFKQNTASHRHVLTKYSAYFIDQMISVITSSMVVVYMLYAVDARTVREFGTMHLIYSVPFVYYGIFRYLYLVHRHNEGEDPLVVLFSDSKMQLNLVLWIIICIGVIYFGL